MCILGQTQVMACFQMVNVWMLMCDQCIWSVMMQLEVFLKVNICNLVLWNMPLMKHASDVILVQVYVDDIIFCSNNNYMCEEFVAAM